MANALTKLPSKIRDSFAKMSKGQKIRLIVPAVIVIVIISAGGYSGRGAATPGVRRLRGAETKKPPAFRPAVSCKTRVLR